MPEVLVGPASGSFTELSLYQDILGASCFKRKEAEPAHFAGHLSRFYFQFFAGLSRTVLLMKRSRD
jgi:hypothetical protein